MEGSRQIFRCVDQVCIGSCTNSSLYDMLKAAAMLKGRTVAPSVSMSVSPGSRQVLTMLANCGALSDILASGARLLECACGPCIGMGFSPNSGGVSLRTFNRNFEGRSGTADGQVYLVSPETAVAAALTGEITDPMLLGTMPQITMPETFQIDDSAVLPPAPEDETDQVEILRGPNIKPFPDSMPQEDTLQAPLVLKVGDNITTDHIMPAGSKILRYHIPGKSQGSRNQHHRRRQQLRAGVFQRARGAGPAVSGCESGHYQEFRENPRGKPDQRRYHAADIQKSGGLRKTASG